MTVTPFHPSSPPPPTPPPKIVIITAAATLSLSTSVNSGGTGSSPPSATTPTSVRASVRDSNSVLRTRSTATCCSRRVRPVTTDCAAHRRHWLPSRLSSSTTKEELRSGKWPRWSLLDAAAPSSTDEDLVFYRLSHICAEFRYHFWSVPLARLRPV